MPVSVVNFLEELMWVKKNIGMDMDDQKAAKSKTRKKDKCWIKYEEKM